MTNQLRLFVLFVVISGALCTVEDYVIMSQCAHNKAINLAAEGTVSVTDISQTQNITIVGRPDFVNNNFKIALYAKETQRYLCFNDHWKLVGMKELQDTCYFNEAIVHGYFVFRSVVDLQRRIGFTQRGRAVGPKKTVNDACYMFTKIPTDQFFHQHTHFSAPKTKSTTTKIPKTEYTHTPLTPHVGRGSGSGRTKTNRFKTQYRQDESVMHNHSGNGQGSGSGSGSGSGNGHGYGNKKFRKQRNGNKQQQQHQQQQQQHKKEMQRQTRGHSYNLNNPKNSTYLNSSRQNLVLSQLSLNNHTNKKYNNSNNSNNNKNNPPQNHQVRHHHNDPNKVARRQQHDQKQKTKKRQRARPSPSYSSSTASLATMATTTTTTSTTKTTSATVKGINSTIPYYTLTSSYSDINPTSVVITTTTDAQSDSRKVMASTLVVTKRKGRRRKNDKVLKTVLQTQTEPRGKYLKEQTVRALPHNSSVEPIYEEAEDYMTSSTDYAWMTNDIVFPSIKTTSVSLPSWETLYPSSSTSYANEGTDYSSASSSSSLVTETNADKKFSSTLESSTMTDINNNNNNLLSQTSVPLPTTMFSTTLTENGIDETISPTITTDLGMTTTNTSTYTPSYFWSNSPSDNTDVHVATIDTIARETLNTYATPKLENTQNTLNTDEDANLISTTQDSENSTAALAFTATAFEDYDGNGNANTFSSSSMDPTAEDDTMKMAEGSTTEFTSSSDNDQSSEATTTTTAILTNICTSETNGSKSMTDCRLATKTTATILNNHKPKQRETSNEQHAGQNDRFPKKQMESTPLNTKPIRIEENTLLPDTIPTALLPQTSKATAATTPMQQLNPAKKSGNHSAEMPTLTTTSLTPAVLSTKSTPTSPLTTRKTFHKSTQRLLATPFHQLTYVRNQAGDIDIDSIDNISIYPDLLDNANDELPMKSSTSRLTMISGYLPTSATATLPESIRIAKIKINRERKRMLSLRNIRSRA